ncbi:methyltransferase domain-containing protein [Methylobacterium sp. WL18]|nr:methyltransferase domain-containing protein [Methylobacterium sp. WL18]
MAGAHAAALPDHGTSGPAVDRPWFLPLIPIVRHGSREPAAMLRSPITTLDGYHGLLPRAWTRDETCDEAYVDAQNDFQATKARAFVLPIVREAPVRTILDVGCGMGGMAVALEKEGYESYGIDLPGLTRRWSSAGRSADRFYLVDPDAFELPFLDGTIDFAFTFGAIEHVGTTNGHADRRPDWHAVRQQWLREIFRVLSPGGRMLIGGPNRAFPIDVAHGPDNQAASWERWLARRLGATVHRPWGDNFLWAYPDVHRYLEGLPYTMEARSIGGFLDFSRVPAFARTAARAYVNRMPRALLDTGFNPWVMALVTRSAES